MSGVCLSEKDLLEGLAAAGVSLPVSEEGAEGILSDSFSAGVLEIPNRLVCQPMEGCDGNFDGTPGELTLRRYLRLAGGGAGLIWFEATAVLPEGRANPRQLMINKDNAGEFARAVELIKEAAIKKNGYAPAVVMQATHSGRYSRPNGFPEPLIAINSPLLEGDRPVSADRIVTDGYLDSVRDALVEGARLAERAGFDGVDIKCCHRYLASELLSAWGRPGRYGGSFENRTRLVRESAAGAAEVCGSGFTVASRFNVYDGYPYPLGFGVSPDGGTEPDYSEGKALASMLFEAGVRLFDVTMGNPYFNPHVNRPFARGGYEAPEP
ncbi:MAG: flavin oxidoreductase/NADH oxidase, partial [Clostridia bacterium]|nr:flavin oxidoreductase/NADH oxidase [Clostridia bacterium]